MFKVCASLEEATEAADNKLLWLYSGASLGWVPAHSHYLGSNGDVPVWLYYDTCVWPPEDFAVLVEDEGEGDG